MTNFIIAAGSSNNRGIEYLLKTKIILQNYPKIFFYNHSKIYKNSSINMSINHLYYNCAFAVGSSLEPLVLYRELKNIEFRLGRLRPYKNSPRTIDLDILWAQNLKFKSGDFLVPHAQAFRRSFFVICAQEVLKSVDWPMPASFSRSYSQLGSNFMSPVAVG